MADDSLRQPLSHGLARDRAEQFHPHVTAPREQGLQRGGGQLQVRPVRSRAHIAYDHRGAFRLGFPGPGLSPGSVLQPADATVAGQGRQALGQDRGRGDHQVRIAERHPQGLDPARVPSVAVAFDADRHRQLEKVVVDVHNDRSAKGSGGGPCPFESGHMAEARQHHRRGPHLRHLGLGQAARGAGARQAFVRSERSFVEDPHCRMARRAGAGEPLDEGDGLGGPELIGEHQETHGRARGELVGVGRGLAREIRCRHGKWTPFARRS